MSQRLALLAALALASCATHGVAPDVVTRAVTVDIPTPIPCIGKPPPPPPQPFTDGAFKAADGPTRFAMLWRYRLETRPWTQMAEAVIAGCEKAAR